MASSPNFLEISKTNSDIEVFRNLCSESLDKNVFIEFGYNRFLVASCNAFFCKQKNADVSELLECTVFK